MSLEKLTANLLVAEFKDTLIDENDALVRQLERLAEMDRRKLFFHYSSLRAYLVGECGMDESCAEVRIRVARMLRRFPRLKGKLEGGKLNLRLILLASGCAHREKLSDPELWELLEGISGMSCTQATREIAGRYPDSTPLLKDRVRPLSETHSEVRFVADEETLDKLEEVRALVAHSHPGIKLGDLVNLLASEYLKRHHPEEKAKRAEARQIKKSQTDSVKTPDPDRVDSRSPSQGLVHALVLKKGYQCSYVDPVTKQRCTSNYGMEKDHEKSWYRGGETSFENMRFLCWAHHRRVSFLEFGDVPIT